MTLCLRSKRSTVQIGAGAPPLSTPSTITKDLAGSAPVWAIVDLLLSGALSENSDSELTPERAA